MRRTFPSAVIENLQPLIDGGRYPVKRVTGEDLIVEADIFRRRPRCCRGGVEVANGGRNPLARDADEIDR